MSVMVSVRPERYGGSGVNVLVSGVFAMVERVVVGPPWGCTRVASLQAAWKGRRRRRNAALLQKAAVRRLPFAVRRLPDEPESEVLDFKEWKTRSISDMVDLVVEMAVCMGNGGGGTVVFGVRDDAIGRTEAIIGVPPEVETSRLETAIHDRTSPKLSPVFEELKVPEGTGRVTIMQIRGTLRPYTETSGMAKIRIGTECKPLTGELRRRIAPRRGEGDYTATTIDGSPISHVSPAAIEVLRDTASAQGAAEDLTQVSDMDLLENLSLIENEKLTRAGLLLCGRQQSIEKYVPNYLWTYLRMRSDVDYVDRADGRNAIPTALNAIMERLMAHNPITTIEQGLFHFEFRQYPEIALREAILNAFSHSDFQTASPILVKHSRDALEISNPGGLVGGVSEHNILHHAPVARNPRLVEALVKLRLVNRSNLGVQRMYRALLREGKEPPDIEDRSNLVKVTFRASDFSRPFRVFVEEEERAGRNLTVDDLLVLQYLTRHPEITTEQAAQICQRSEARARELLSKLDVQYEFLDRGGTGRGTYWRLRPAVHRRVDAHGNFARDKRIEWETAKTRVLDVLRQRRDEDRGLANKEIRRILAYNRQQVTRLMAELRDEGHAKVEGHGAGATWKFVED